MSKQPTKKTETEEPKKMSADEAQFVLDQARQIRIAECGAAIQNVLTEHNCDLDVAMIVTQKGNTPQLTIVSKD
jgi:hypothetical protein